MPSKSRSAELRGVSRFSSGPGRCSSTVRSRPTSLSAPAFTGQTLRGGGLRIPCCRLADQLRADVGEECAVDRTAPQRATHDAVTPGRPFVDRWGDRLVQPVLAVARIDLRMDLIER